MKYTTQLTVNQISKLLEAIPGPSRGPLCDLASELSRPDGRPAAVVLSGMAIHAQYSPVVTEIVNALMPAYPLSQQDRLMVMRALARATSARLTWAAPQTPNTGPEYCQPAPAAPPLAGRVTPEPQGPGEKTTDPEIADRETRIDPEIGRICVALRNDNLLRLWAILRDSGAGRGGWLDRDSLYNALGLARDYTRRHYNRLINAGAGLFWQLWPDNRIALVGGKKLAASLTRLAAQTDPGLVATNRPGAREVVIPLGGNLAEWRGHLYGDWLAHRGDPTISRGKMAALFARDETSLIRWEQSNQRIRISRNYGQVILDGDDQADRYMDYLPDHPGLKRAYTWDGRILLTWRMPNTYHASYRQLGARYRATQRREAANSTNRPANNGLRGQRWLFDTAKRLRDCNRRRGITAGMVWRGRNRAGSGVWELSTGDCITGPNSRARGAARRQFVAEYHALRRTITEKIELGHFYNPLTGLGYGYTNRDAVYPGHSSPGGGGPGGGGYPQVHNYPTNPAGVVDN